MQNSLAEGVGLLKELPSTCCTCGKPVCLRQQLMGMSLGYIDRSYCLACIAQETQRTPEDVLEAVIPYIRNRDCFSKPWFRYKDESYCPYPETCFPKECFGCREDKR